MIALCDGTASMMWFLTRFSSLFLSGSIRNRELFVASKQ